MKSIIFRIAIFLSVTFLANQAVATTYAVSGSGKITFIENGWFGEGLAIKMSSGHPGCPAADTDYAVPSSHPSYKEIVAFATSAFMASANVEIVVETGVCTFGDRNKILSIRLIK